jgi:RNA polymerase sigma-32 factor
LKSWNLVKLGTTQAQRKLFFRIGDIGQQKDEKSRSERIDKLAEELNVTSDDVIEVEARVKARDWSLDEPLGEDKHFTAMEMLEDKSDDQETRMMSLESDRDLCEATDKALRRLDERERFIVEKRFMDDSPWTLQRLGEHFGTSRERMRQIEKRALGKLRRELSSSFSEAAA